MDFHMQSTIFGQLVRWVLRNGSFKYPDEIDPFLWKSAVQRRPSQELQQSHQSRKPERSGQIDGSQRKMQTGEALNKDVETVQKSTLPRYGPQDVLVVGWYGPDDPEASDPDGPNMTCSLVPVADTLGSRAESPELAQQLETSYRFPDVCSQLCSVHRKFDLRTGRGESHGRVRRRRGRCDAGALTFHIVRDAS